MPPALSVTCNCTVTLPATLASRLAVAVVVGPLKLARPAPLRMVHWKLAMVAGLTAVLAPPFRVKLLPAAGVVLLAAITACGGPVSDRLRTAVSTLPTSSVTVS